MFIFISMNNTNVKIFNASILDAFGYTPDRYLTRASAFYDVA